MTANAKRRARTNAVSAEELGSLSHEFRTPLNGVLGMARLLEGTRLTAEQRSYVAALRESGEHLLSLVNDVLDFARLGAGKVELRLAPMDVEDLLRSVCELLSPRAQEKRLEIAWAAPAGVGRIVADEGRLRQILLNFAGNAVKFTETGGVLLSVERRGRRLRFVVEDTGPGVAPQARDRIFEAFAQAEPAHATHFGGAGLGLAIARSLASAMGGEVGVGTAAGGGAAFWFEAAFATAPDQSAPAAPPLAGRTVGLGSPNPVVREGARRQLEACGARVVVADSVEAVVAGTGPDDVLLLDHALADGARTLRRPQGRTAVVLLELNQRDRIARYRQAGFAGYLVKPLRRRSLAERVLAAVGAEPAGRTDDDERAAPAIAPGARVLLVEDNPVNALLAQALLSREGCAVTHVSSGQAALEAAELTAFDLVLMDMRMPGMSGVDTARALRRAGVPTPIVALTANAFEDDRHTCLAAGMDDFLVKPLSPAALRAALARWTRPGWTGKPQRARAG